MNNVRAALLELVNLQKQRISQLEVQNRHQATELCKWMDTTGHYTLLNSEFDDDIVVYGESWKMISRNRKTEEITIKRVRPK